MYMHRSTLVYIYIYTSVDPSIKIDRVARSCHQWIVPQVVVYNMFVPYFVKYFVKYLIAKGGGSWQWPVSQDARVLSVPCQAERPGS